MIDFVSLIGGAELQGQTVYLAAEHSFQFRAEDPAELARRIGDRGVTSLAIGTLQLEVALATGALLFAWGYHPRRHWRAMRLPQVAATAGVVRVGRPHILQPSISLRVPAASHWPTLYDPQSGWVAVGDPDPAAPSTLVRIATDTVLGLSGPRLTVVWIRPVFIAANAD